MQRARSPEVISKDADSSQTLSCQENAKKREWGEREREAGWGGGVNRDRENRK